MSDKTELVDIANEQTLKKETVDQKKLEELRVEIDKFLNIDITKMTRFNFQQVIGLFDSSHKLSQAWLKELDERAFAANQEKIKGMQPEIVGDWDKEPDPWFRALRHADRVIDAFDASIDLRDMLTDVHIRIIAALAKLLADVKDTEIEGIKLDKEKALIDGLILDYKDIMQKMAEELRAAREAHARDTKELFAQMNAWTMSVQQIIAQLPAPDATKAAIVREQLDSQAVDAPVPSQATVPDPYSVVSDEEREALGRMDKAAAVVYLSDRHKNWNNKMIAEILRTSEQYVVSQKKRKVEAR